MIISMTGYGKGTVQKDDFIIEAEIKTLNSRFLDISAKLPKALSDKEFDLREKIKNKIKRGKVSLFVYFKKEGLDGRASFINKEAILSAVSMLKEIQEVSGIKDDLTFNDLLVFQNQIFGEPESDINNGYNDVVKAVYEALDQLLEMRKREGEELFNDFIERLEKIESGVNKIESLSNTSTVEYFEKLKERAKQLISEITEYDERLKMELALLAEKYDITEECVRLKSHIKMFRDTMINGDEAGRKLNFITQEMNREVNTINSKSVSTEISANGILIKEELEKIREQIQNIE